MHLRLASFSFACVGTRLGESGCSFVVSVATIKNLSHPCSRSDTRLTSNMAEGRTGGADELHFRETKHRCWFAC